MHSGGFSAKEFRLLKSFFLTFFLSSVLSLFLSSAPLLCLLCRCIAAVLLRFRAVVRSPGASWQRCAGQIFNLAGLADACDSSRNFRHSMRRCSTSGLFSTSEPRKFSKRHDSCRSMHRRARWALVPFYAVRDRALLGGALGKSSTLLA